MAQPACISTAFARVQTFLATPKCLLLLLSPMSPLTGSRTDPGVSGLSVNCLKEVTESATLNPFCYPSSC